GNDRRRGQPDRVARHVGILRHRDRLRDARDHEAGPELLRAHGGAVERTLGGIAPVVADDDRLHGGEYAGTLRGTGRGAAWVARSSGGLEVPSSNLGAPIWKTRWKRRVCLRAVAG